MKTLLDVKLKDISKRTILRGSTSIQINLKLAYHFITYLDSPIYYLKRKEQDTSIEEARKEDLHKQFLTVVSSLPSDPKRPLTGEQIKRIGEIRKSAERFFDDVVVRVDKVYEYPPWVDTYYHTVCNEDSPDGRRYGENRDYYRTLTYPGDIGH